MLWSRRGVRPRRDEVEHAGLPRVITLAMAWCAGAALGLATGDMTVALVLTAVITAGHGVSWRTRTWHSARWQLLLLLPISGVAVLLVPSLGLAFHGDWLQPMRYLLALQSLASFYLHSRASLYAAQMLSGIVLLVSIQLALDSLFLVPFFAFFLLLLAFLASATSGDARRGAIGHAPWPRRAQRAAWAIVGLALLSVAGLGMFLVLPWGSVIPPGGAGSMLPLTGEVGQGNGGGGLLGLDDGSREETGAETPTLPESLGTAGAGGAGSADVAPAAPAGAAGNERGDSAETGRETPPLPASPRAADAGPGAGPDRVVMQVRSPVATYWRGRTYSVFDGQRWLADGGVAMEHAVATGRRYTQTFFLREPQETPPVGYSPLGWQRLGGAPEGSPLEAGDIYRVTSERRDFRQTRHAAASGGGELGPTAVLPSRVRELAALVTSGAATELDQALAITRYLRSGYRYVASTEPWEPTQSVEEFLLGGGAAGNAYDFAAAQTALAAAAGLDARMVSGYLPGELDPLSGTYVVRASDAHAWTEVNFGGAAGWVPIDGNPREDGRATAVARGSAVRAVAGLFELRVGDELREGARRAIEQVAAAGAVVLAVLGLAAAGAAGYAAYRYRRRRRAGRARYTLLAAGERRQVVLAYGRLMRRLRRHVEPREAGETVGGYFARLAEGFPHLEDELAQVHALVSEAAYRPVPLDGARAEAMRERLLAAGRRIGVVARW